MTPNELRQAFTTRIAPLLEKLRATPRYMFALADADSEKTHDGKLLALASEDAADLVERDLRDVVDTTAQELELAIDKVPPEFRAITLADADLTTWPWSEQTKAGRVLRAWDKSAPWPEDVDAWLQSELARPPAKEHAAWTPGAMATLYLANPVTVAARCVRALENLDTKKTEDAHLTTARTALEEMNVDAENMGRLAGDLADELRKRLGEARAMLNVDAALESIRHPSAHTMLPWDEKAAAFYEGLSTDHAQGSTVADALREAARRRWTKSKDLFHLWTPQQPHGVPRFAFNLARVLWKDVVEPRTQREIHKPAALVRLVYSGVADLLRPGRTLKDSHLMDKDGRQLMLLERLSALDVPAVEMDAIPKLLQRGVQLFGSIQAHRTVRHFVTEGHRRVLANEADARRLQYDGGWARMAEDAGISESEEARAIVLALAHVPFLGPNSEQGNLLSYTWRPHAPGRKARVTIVLGDMLLPHYVHALTGKTRTQTEARQLVPVVDLPGLVGRKNEHGPQATLQWLVMEELRRRAVELATTGSVRITDAMWREMMEQAGLPPATLTRVLDRWTQDGEDAPAFLARVDRDRFTLAPAFRVALDFMTTAGQNSGRASVAGKASRRVVGKRNGKKAKKTGV